MSAFAKGRARPNSWVEKDAAGRAVSPKALGVIGGELFTATTNWANAAAFQTNFPHTFNSLQHLVMAMADFSNNRGKKVFLEKTRVWLLTRISKTSSETHS
jgi:hypothetical protein